ncbi:hypothetical protein [Cryobacterium zhongshanensis]|uniref:Uncharacterized protein n=1 Tax=Cryobacterium zhongshanensis TaxID=2928153 RepID=A0AA41QXV6_9MICO|nr:hypothetical protein [Cryobacterium zhongshanensis]MCI4659666.1 hypothetical protein [Cryobacterium zhongshanensis]
MANAHKTLTENLRRLTDPASGADEIETKDALAWIDAAIAALESLPTSPPGETEREALVARMHARNEFDYDECDHGTYTGGPSNGEPYAMCERQADSLIADGYVHAIEPLPAQVAFAPVENWEVWETGQPNGSGVIEPSDNREWFSADRVTHHRRVHTFIGPWEPIGPPVLDDSPIDQGPNHG